MLLWRKPLGMRTFGLTPERAELTASLAANQGLYNGFLAAGLAVGLVAPQPTAFHFKLFFLTCVIIAGLFGAATRVATDPPHPGPASGTRPGGRAPRWSLTSAIAERTASLRARQGRPDSSEWRGW